MVNLKNIAVERLHACVPANLSVPVTKHESPRPHARHRKTGYCKEYLPAVEWNWFCQMSSMPGKAGYIGLALYRYTVMRKSRTVMFCCRELAEQLGVNRKAVGYAMKVLEAAGIIRAQRRRGRFATIELLIAPEN